MESKVLCQKMYREASSNDWQAAAQHAVLLLKVQTEKFLHLGKISSIFREILQMPKTNSTNSNSRLLALQKTLKIRFRKEKLFLAALTHTSFASNQPKISAALQKFSPYERLEFFGDAILNFVVCQKLFTLYPTAHEGTLSRLRSTLVSKKMLTCIAKKLRLQQFVLAGNGGKIHALSNSKLLSDSLESLIAAIYLDQGLNTASKFIWSNWKAYFDEKKLARFDPNPKSTLQEMVQKIFKTLPSYETKPHSGGFIASTVVNKRLRGKGTGKSKQEAEAQAALELLQKLKRSKTYSRFWKRDSKRVAPAVTKS